MSATTGCTVIAPAAEADKIAEIGRTVSHGDTVLLGEWQAEVIDVGGHTNGHIAYHLPQATLASACFSAINRNSRLVEWTRLWLWSLF